MSNILHSGLLPDILGESPKATAKATSKAKKNKKVLQRLSKFDKLADGAALRR